MTLVLGIDPGGATGLCTYDTDSPLTPALMEVGPGVRGFVGWWQSSERFAHYDAVVCESFRLDDRTKKPDLTPVEIIGFLKGVGVPVIFQTPGQAKSLITNAVLKRAGLYPKRGSVGGGHTTDALRHALYYLVNRKHRPTVELLWPREL